MSTQKTDSKAVEFIYQDTEIHFLLGNEKNVMVNATEMAKLFNKQIDNFTRLEGTKLFIQALLKLENSKIAPSDVRELNQKEMTESDLIQSKNGVATYYHRKLALEFASWLDVDFKVWIIDTIDEILFGKAKKVGDKISEAELEKEKIKKLIKEARDSRNETAIAILNSFDKLKEIEKEKKKSMTQFSNQYKMF
ncbi:KilA-N domain-containing protein [Flavobacterium sp. RSP29]|uniref:KilA-N domain-containing protein n=1 Tax=Flavobacterium sp. RSP29 TaxID=3401731 RepID=UPI003AADB48D